MDRLPEGMKVMEIMLRGGFMLMLAAASYQDFREHRIHIGIFILFGTLGTAARGIQLMMEFNMLSLFLESGGIWAFAGRRLADLFMAMALGGILLYISVVTGGAVGRADGWFFVVSGLYLGLVRNVILFCGGLFLCFMVCCVLVFWGIFRGMNLKHFRLPFLPFLIPAGLGVMFL